MRDKAATIAANRQAEGSHVKPIGCSQCSALMAELRLARVTIKTREEQLVNACDDVDALTEEIRKLTGRLETAHQGLAVQAALNKALREELIESRDLRRSLELAHKALEVKESLNETLRREVDALRGRGE